MYKTFLVSFLCPLIHDPPKPRLRMEDRKNKTKQKHNPNHTCAFNLPFRPSFLLYLILTALAPDAVAPINAAEFLGEKSVRLAGFLTYTYLISLSDSHARWKRNFLPGATSAEPSSMIATTRSATGIAPVDPAAFLSQSSDGKQQWEQYER